MYQGNWTCSQCGGAITELPFQPKSEKGLTCRACFMKNKGGGGSGVPQSDEEAVSDPGIGMGSSTEPPSDIPEDAGLASEPAPMEGGFEDATPVAPGEKPKFEGDWQCATCGAAITSLPFQPRNTDNLKCLDCFKASKGS